MTNQDSTMTEGMDTFTKLPEFNSHSINSLAL